jgi:hypothetical protein
VDAHVVTADLTELPAECRRQLGERRDALAAAIELHSAKFEMMGFEGLHAGPSSPV